MVFVVDADVMVYGYLVIAVLISAGLAALVCRSVPKKNFPLLRRSLCPSLSRR